MIRRRLSKHLKSQNWFAVAVDFVIVVVGVFMGLQVQDWNEARKERIEEHALLSRLHAETVKLLETQREELVSLSERADILMSVNPVLFSQAPLRSLSDLECRHIVASHVFRRPPDELPVLDEMLSTGRFDVLQDGGIKEFLRSYVIFRGRARAYYDEATNELFRLHSRFPDLIALGRAPLEAGTVDAWTALSGEGFRWNRACDVERMRANQAFLNEYVDNLSRTGSMIQFTEQRHEHLEELESALSAHLGVPAESLAASLAGNAWLSRTDQGTTHAPVADTASSAETDMTASASALLEALPGDRRERIGLAFDSEERMRWHFIPPEMFPRAGLALNELNERQAIAAHGLLKAGLSQDGYLTATAIMQLEDVLKELEKSDRFARNPADYYLTVFGTPSVRGTWAWRFEGHHLSLHFTIVDGRATVSTPSFFGASPAEVRTGPQRGRRALAIQEDAARALLQSLDASQRSQTVVSSITPDGILSGNAFPVEPAAPSGLTASKMTPVQQTLLRSLLESHTAVMAADIAAERWRRINDGGFGDIGFAWAGSRERGRPHYYRVQGPTFLIEYDNTQNDGNHKHIVWRDFDGDFGRDLLREHVHSVQH